MISRQDFITMSLDLNLFFLRIMKEHSFFLGIAFTPVNSQWAAEADNLRIGFEKLLAKAVSLANGNVSEQALASRQFATEYTADAEELTNFYTGVPFNTDLTKDELMLRPANTQTLADVNAVAALNHNAFRLTSALVAFKERLLKNVLACRMFTLNYPLLIEHIIREARLFLSSLRTLNERRLTVNNTYLINQEIFWNRQMAEHAKFIAGLLDPSEEILIDTARMFGKEFDMLTAEAKQAQTQTMDLSLTENTIEAMERLRDFKTAGTQGLLNCSIKSIIIPLLADHVLREANHYLCVLGKCDND